MIEHQKSILWFYVVKKNNWTETATSLMQCLLHLVFWGSLFTVFLLNKYILFKF